MRENVRDGAHLGLAQREGRDAQGEADERGGPEREVGGEREELAREGKEERPGFV